MEDFLDSEYESGENFDDSMDSDAYFALASSGWGTAEDYYGCCDIDSFGTDM